MTYPGYWNTYGRTLGWLFILTGILMLAGMVYAFAAHLPTTITVAAVVALFAWLYFWAGCWDVWSDTRQKRPYQTANRVILAIIGAGLFATAPTDGKIFSRPGMSWILVTLAAWMSLYWLGRIAGRARLARTENNRRSSPQHL